VPTTNKNSKTKMKKASTNVGYRWATGGLRPEFTVFVKLGFDLLVVVAEEGAMMATASMRILKRLRPSVPRKRW